MLDGTPETQRWGFDRVHHVWDHRYEFGFDSNPAFPQEIDAAIMGDAEQPRLERPAVVKLVELSISLEQRLLHNIFTVHYRARHAGAVAVQARTKLRYSLQERQVACFEGTGRIRIFCVIHFLREL